MVDYLSLIGKHARDAAPRLVSALTIHSTLVTRKVLAIAKDYLERNPDVEVDLRLLEEMGMLHDIGVLRTGLPPRNTEPYLTHITHGTDLLEEEGLLVHARAAKTHTSIPAEEVEEKDLPLPVDDYTPETVEEELLCLADYFFKKELDSLFEELSPAEVRQRYEKHGEDAVERFTRLYEKYCK